MKRNLLPLLLLVACLAARADDWPTHRGDAGRSGFTAQSLPDALALSWKYEPRHAPSPAWSDRDTRMPFDKGPLLAIAGGRVVFGHSAEGTVQALDATTGEPTWTFITEAPVRLAPAIWKDRVFVPSDDGWLYALALEDGKLLWKHHGGPTGSWVLGNDRLVSRWPVRGGPVVADDTVYVAAGVWPSEGIYVHALDPETGVVRWSNDSSGTIWMPQPHPGAEARSGLSAQGNLTVAGDRLLVPTGRAVPAVLDRSDGRFLYFHLQKYGHRVGSGAGIVAVGSELFSGGCLFDVATGELEAQGLGSVAAVTPTDLVIARGSVLEAYPRDALWTTKEVVDRRGQKSTQRVLSPPRWSVPLDAPPIAMVAVGDSLILGTQGRVRVLRPPEPEPVLDAEVDGAVHDLAVAGGRLYATTERGTLYAFAAEVDAPRPVGPPDSTIASKLDPSLEAVAEEILERTGIHEGHGVDLGCGSGELAVALALHSELTIHAVDPDPSNVARARKLLVSRGLLGTRVSVHLGDPSATELPSSFANLVVSGRSIDDGADAAPWDEARRLQRPYGGTVCVGKPGALRVEVRGALENAGTWTHQYADPANTNCSGDERVHGPLGILWFTDFGFTMANRHGRGPAPLFLDGRLYIEGLDGLLCVDAYNGWKLWEVPFPGILKAYDQDHLMGTAGTGSNLCIAESGLYIHNQKVCLRLDPLTGKRLGEIPPPSNADGSPGTWGYLAVEDGLLFGTRSNTEHIVKWRYLKGDMDTQFSESSLFFTLDAKTGEPRWTFRPEASIRHNAIAVGSGRVYVIDRPIATGDRIAPPEKPEHPPGRLVCLDASSGKPLWESRDDIFATTLALSTKHDALLLAYQATRFRLDSEVGGRLAVVRASTGERLWDIQADYASRPILNDRTIYAQPGSWDLLTGKPGEFRFERSYGCGILASARNLMVFRSATLGYVDLLDGVGTENYGGIRPACWINALPVGGLVLMPDATDRCVCSYLNKASVALAPYGLRAPRIAPPGGDFDAPATVTLSAATEGAEIRYTLDGTTPTESSPRYTAPLSISESCLLKARAFRRGSPPSVVEAARFTVQVSLAPYFRPPADLAGDLGDFRPVLTFDDGREVTTPEEWTERREEILRSWRSAIGAWPPLLEKPAIEVLDEAPRESFVQKTVRVPVASDLKVDGYLLVPERKEPAPAVLVVYYEPETSAGLDPEKKLRDFGYQLTRRGFVTLSIGWPRSYTEAKSPQMQPLSCLAYIAANAQRALAALPEVDGERIGVCGHSFGGKWALFAMALHEDFACGAWSDPGIVFDETRPNVNYWEPWYLGWEEGRTRKPGVPTPDNPRTGPYRKLVADGRDLHELHALVAPRPFLVSGGAEDPPSRWKALHHVLAVNRVLGVENRVALTSRAGHSPTEASNEVLYLFFEQMLGSR